MQTTLALLLAMVLLPGAALAQAEPEAVYAKDHRGAVSGDVDEMAGYWNAPQRAEVATMSVAQKQAAAKMMAALLPRAYLLNDKRVNPNGQSARLIVSGPGTLTVGEKPETLYGIINLEKENGEWKVGNMDCGNRRPERLARPASK